MMIDKESKTIVSLKKQYTYSTDVNMFINSVDKLKTIIDINTDLESTRPFVVTHTNLGWNTPKDKEFPRRIISGELYNATRNHTHYNATAWADLERHPDPSRQIIAFMDVETCFEVNFPIYGHRKFPYFDFVSFE
jgi:hypothetical protein